MRDVVDLNLWRLAYDSTILEFGTHESGHPFTRQVTVGPAELDVEDGAHPLSDGSVPGRDYFRGRTLGFAGAHLSTMPHTYGEGRRWGRPMDDAAAFEGAWRARSVHETPGKLATLTNVDRGRMVYGRPRPYVPDHEKVRHGWLTYETTFATVDDRFYGAAEKVAVVGVDPGPAAAFTFPVSFPHSGVEPGTGRSWVVNDGTDHAWPIIEFRRGGRPAVELLDGGGGVLWRVAVDKNLAYDEVLTVDTRPWRRTVTLNGSQRHGLLRGTRLDQVRVPVGSSEVRLLAVDTSGLAQAAIRWRDVFGSL